jgi:hypothetical protein
MYWKDGHTGRKGTGLNVRKGIRKYENEQPKCFTLDNDWSVNNNSLIHGKGCRNNVLLRFSRIDLLGDCNKFAALLHDQIKIKRNSTYGCSSSRVDMTRDCGLDAALLSVRR